MDRSTYIGGSDARRILEGDWLSLYEEKVGIRQAEDLSNVFRVQLGIFTEPFHYNWLVQKYQMQLGPLQDARRDNKRPWLGGKLDCWWFDKDTFVDLKHSNERADSRAIGDFYQPQIAHYCALAKRDHGYLSVIAGNDDPFLVKVEPSALYIEQLLGLEEAFWWHVYNKQAPERLDGVPFEGAIREGRNLKINGFRKVSMQGNNQWADLATTIAETKEAAGRFDKAKDAIKKMIEPDVGEAEGHGIVFKRDKNGALRMTLKEAA